MLHSGSCSKGNPCSFCYTSDYINEWYINAEYDVLIDNNEKEGE